MQKFFMLLMIAGLPIAAFLAVPNPNPANLLNTSTSSKFDRESHLLETGQPSKPRKPPPVASDIRVISYNIRYRSGEKLHQLIKLFREDPEIGAAAILGLQEVDRNRKRSGNKNTVAQLADELGMYYAWTAPPATSKEQEEETGVSILSVYPLTDVRRLVLPHKGPGGRRRVALGATVKVGPKALRVYNIHGETRIPVSRKLEQMKAVISDLARYDKEMPAIVLGDLNTWEPAAIDETYKLFIAEKFHTPFSTESTFRRRVLLIPFELKLDWIWLRNMEATSHGIDRTIELSDHWPLWVVLRSPTGPKQGRR